MTEHVGPSRRIAEFVATTTIKDIPATALENAKLSILDTIGVGIAALDQPAAQGLQRYVRAMGGEPIATVLGMGGFKTSPPMASLANGCCFNMLDFDAHTPTFVLPGLLALGEMLGANGARILEAYVLAEEATARIDHTIDSQRRNLGGPTYRGWYHVSICGPIGGALGASKMLGLSAEQTLGAMGVAACSSGGTRQNFGRQCKSMLSGNSASDGVAAALLAREGVTGDPEILEGRVGLVNAVCFPGEIDWEPIMEHLGNPYGLVKRAGMKFYPGVSNLHPIIAALEPVARSSGFDASKIVRIEAKLTPHPGTAISDTARGISDYPVDGLSAEMSFPYAIAATLLDGTFTIDHVMDAKVQDPRIRELASKVELQTVKRWEEQREVLTIHFADGRSVVAGAPESRRAPNADDFVAKFRACAGRRMGAGDVEGIYQRVMELEKLATVGGLTALLAKA